MADFRYQIPTLARTSSEAPPLNIDPLTGKPISSLPLGQNPVAYNPLTANPALNPLANPSAVPLGKPADTGIGKTDIGKMDATKLDAAKSDAAKSDGTKFDIGKFDLGSKIPGLGSKFDLGAEGLKAQSLGGQMQDGRGLDWRGLDGHGVRAGLPGANEGGFSIGGIKLPGINFDLGGGIPGAAGGKGNLIPDASAIGKGFGSALDGITNGAMGQNPNGMGIKNPLTGLATDTIVGPNGGSGLGGAQGGFAGDGDASIQMGVLGLNDKGGKPGFNNEDGKSDKASKGTKSDAAPGSTVSGKGKPGDAKADKDKADKKDKADTSTQQEDQTKKEPSLRKRYVIKNGDTLESIAEREFGDKRFAALLLTINRAAITVVGQGKNQKVLLSSDQVIWLPAKSELELHRKFFFGSQKVVDNSPS
jgi:hypothetical protein